MVFISHILNLPVVDNKGQRVGFLTDLLIGPGDAYPRITAAVVTPSRPRFGAPSGLFYVPAGQVATLDRPEVRLRVAAEDLGTYEPKEHELRVARDLLDKQIVDTQGRRIVKVNDVKLGDIAGEWRLMGVDIGLRAFLRRLGAEQTADILGRLLPIHLDERLVTWNYIEPLAGELDNVRLTVSHTQLAELHPADIADIVEQMAPAEGTAVLTGLDARVAAETLAEIEPELQARFLSQIESDRASDLLEMLPPDEAADLLSDLPEPQAERLLSLMAQEQAADVRKLLTYEENTAGGRMTTDILVLDRRMTVEETIATLREAEFGKTDIYYLYVVDEERRLLGVVSLRALVTARPGTLVGDIMDTSVVSVQLDTDQEEVARVIRKYDLLAVPVVDIQGVVQGVVTVDDVLDVMQEEAAEDIGQLAGSSPEGVGLPVTPLRDAIRRVGWLGAALAGGVAAGGVVQAFAGPLHAPMAVFYFVPLILNLVNALGAQSFALAGARGGDEVRRVVRHEGAVGGFLGLLAGLVVALGTYSWLGDGVFAAALGVGLGLALVMAAVLGGAAPVLIQRTRLDPAVASGPVVDAVVSLVALLLCFGLISTVRVA